MSISQQVGASSLNKPGVCTSATRPATPYEGQMIYETDTDLTYIYNGSAWQQVSGGTAVGNSGLVYITSGALSGTATNFANCFTSTYNNYRIVIDGIQGSAAVDVYVQFLNGTTPFTTANYSWAWTGLRVDNVAANTATSGNARAYTGVSATVGGSILGSGALDIFGPFQSQRTWMTGVSTGYETDYYSRSGMGMCNNTNSFDGFRILTSSAVTITGNVTVYGYRKA